MRRQLADVHRLHVSARVRQQPLHAVDVGRGRVVPAGRAGGVGAPTCTSCKWRAPVCEGRLPSGPCPALPCPRRRLAGPRRHTHAPTKTPPPPHTHTTTGSTYPHFQCCTKVQTPWRPCGPAAWVQPRPDPCLGRTCVPCVCLPVTPGATTANGTIGHASCCAGPLAGRTHCSSASCKLRSKKSCFQE